MLKSRILGQNPCNVEMIFKMIRSSEARPGRLVVYVPWRWLCGTYAVRLTTYLRGSYGGRYRDTVRIYADTPESTDLEVFRKSEVSYR